MMRVCQHVKSSCIQVNFLVTFCMSQHLFVATLFWKTIPHACYANELKKKMKEKENIFFISFFSTLASKQSNFGSYHHSDIFQSYICFSKRVPNDTIPCLDSRVLSQTVKITKKTAFKPPSRETSNSTIVFSFVIVLVFRSKLHSIVVK